MTSIAGDDNFHSPRGGLSSLGIPRRILVFALLMLAGLLAGAERTNYSEELKSQMPSGTPRLPDALSNPGILDLNPTSFVVHTDDWIRWRRWHIRTNWLHSEGPASPLGGRENFPMVQVFAEGAYPQRSNGSSRLAAASTPSVGAVGARVSPVNSPKIDVSNFVVRSFSPNRSGPRRQGQARAKRESETPRMS
jgi:hypothetical protein